MKGNVWMVAFILVQLIWTSGCNSPEQTRRILSIFFDGVPQQEDTTLIASVTDDTLQVSDSIQPGQFVEAQPALCYMCHEDFADKYEFLHGPVAAGYCTVCHHPHFEKNEYLLKHTGQDLCLYCHDSNRILKGETHESIGDMNCTECHNPHGGSDKYLFN
jgi:predicted CXXCH cytochrome family protein